MLTGLDIEFSIFVERPYREVAYKTCITKCLTTVANQPFLGVVRESYSHSQWLSAEKDMMSR